ncbi:hypothetical protein FZC66_07975 [Priestia megaterium]|nr:hypothetical protein FZC66_07975 [Priestia megaterium]
MAITRTTYLRDLCLTYQEARFYAMYIPRSYEKAAIKYFQLKKDEKIIAYLDCALFGFSGKRGVYFTTKGLHWKCWRKKKGYISWSDFSKIKSITVRQEGMVCFNGADTFYVNGNDYPIQRLVCLLKKIQRFIHMHSHEYMCKEYIYPSIPLQELTSICTSFQKRYPLLESAHAFPVTDQIAKEDEKEIRSRLQISKHERIIAHLNTYPLQKTEGITICEEGIYFSKSFMTLYYPWNLFRHVSLSVETDELKVAKKFSLPLNNALMSSGEVMSFLKQIKRYLHTTYENEPEIKKDDQLMLKMLVQ